MLSFKQILLVVPLLLAGSLLFANDIDITKYGAIGDSTTLNTVFIQKAIDDCSKSGGGRVIFPPGRYLSGTIVLKDNVVLQIQKGAVLLGSTNVDDYQNMDPFADGLGIDVGWALLVAVDANNIGIEGEGAIDGQGSKLKARQILTDTRPESQRWGRRPFLLRIVRCNGVTVKGVTLNYAAAWTSHYFQSRHIQIENVKIVSVGVAHNDGMDIDGCQDVHIMDCDVVSGDDALCFKTTSSQMACSDIVVSGLRLKSNQGAIKMGTESMAPFENIKISGCYIYETNNGGIKLLTVDGAHLRNVEISGIKMVDVKTPILIRLGSRLSVFRKGNDTKQETGTLENVVIRDVKAQAAVNAQLMPPSGILITGVPGHYITNLRLENIAIDLAGGGTAENARQAVPEAIDKYPEVKTFGPLVPAYGVWARHVKGLKLINVAFTISNNDLRPAFVCEDGADIEINHWKIPATSGAEAIIRLENVDKAQISNTEVKGSAAAFVRVEGAGSSGVQVAGNTLNGIKPVETSAEVKPGATTQAAIDTISKPKRPAARAPVPAVLPGKGLSQHDFLFAGEWDTRKDSQTVFIIRKGVIAWSYAIPIKDHNNVLSEFSDIHLLSNGNVLYACKTGAAEINPAKKTVWSYECPPGTECHSAQPIGNDKVFLCQNGVPAKAMLVNIKTGQVEMEHEVATAKPGDPKSVHGQFRHIRFTKAGTYLLAHLNMGKVIEYDKDWQPIWSVDAPSAWAAVRLKNGNTLISGNQNGYVREVNPQGEIVWELNKDDLPGFPLYTVHEVTRLANGNTVICNWGGFLQKEDWDKVVQIIEVTPDKKVVWAVHQWKDPDLGPSSCIQLLDEKGKEENGDLQR